MFSCILVQGCEEPEGDDNGTGEFLVAERVCLDVQVVSNAGRGTAECRYAIDRDCKDVVACVPSTICVKDASTQQVKVTKCRMEVQKDGHTLHHSSLQLTKLDSEYSDHAKNLPSYVKIKKSLNRSVVQEDLILYLGHFEANTTATLKFEFLLQLKMVAEHPSAPSTHSPLYYVIDNNIPSQHVTYKLRLASHMHVINVSPTSSSNPLTNFSWFYVDRTKQVIQVSYEAAQLRGNSSSDASFGIEMSGNHANSVQSACCSCLVQTSTFTPRHTFLAAEMEEEYDGVMMLSSRITKDQLLGGCLRTRDPPRIPTCPSEFVFLVDCSASMNPFIDSVIATLITCIKSLPEGCYFNMIAFGSNFCQLFHESKEYSKSSVKKAVDFANQLKASLGGTELLHPLKWIYKSSRKEEMPCQVFIITDVDQEVKDIPYVLSTIKKHRHYAR